MRGDGTAAAIEAPRRHIIERPRLTRLLDEADARILMLVAPAGYGKTTLARQWVDAGGRRALWVTASAAFADANRLAIRVRDALDSIIGAPGAHLEERLRSGPPEWAEPDAVGTFLGNAARWEDDLWLVVDDYHHLASVDAERFFDAFVAAAHARVLVASRRRPTWATARRLLYGEIHELGRSALAMNHDEALEVFAGRSGQRLAGLMALADGWPAILGLAANLAAADVPRDVVPEAIYDFFAEELYQSASADLRLALEKFALAPTLTREVADRLTNNADELLDEGVRLGFLQFEKASDSYPMHSLIRDFLRRRRHLGATEMDSAVERLARYYLDEDLFDDLFVLVKDLPHSPTTRTATDEALTRLLEDSRIESLLPWLDHAHDIRLTSPAVDLAGAEVAFGSGRYKQAELLAAQSGERFPVDAVLKARAWFRAGLSAYHENRSDAALKHHAAALDNAIRQQERLHAVWGLLTATLELEQDAGPWIAELEAAGRNDPVSRVRLANARLGSGYRFGGIREALNDGEAVLPLLERIDDAMVSSAFLNSYAVCLVLAADYEGALAVVAREMAVIDDCGLSFAVPHALASRIGGNVGRRHFAEALRDLEHAERLARSANDAFSVGNIAANRIKLLLSQGDAASAVACAESSDFLGRLPALRGELLSLHALALAVLGDFELARELAAAARSETRSVEANGYAAWADVIVSRAQRSNSAPALAHDAFRSALTSGCLHPVVCAYRASPEIAVDLAAEPSLSQPLRELMWRAHDDTLGRGVGFEFPRKRSRDLSPRETEVLRLLGEGLSNRDIAKRLFISEVTAKAHVRNILEKLGVRSRTEAALVSANYLPDRDEAV